MWANFRASMVRNDKKELKNTQKSFNVNDEYLCALRTKSYAEFFTKAQSLIKETIPFNERIILLHPHQETIPSILESPFFMKFPELKNLLINYFYISAETSNLFFDLLQTIKETQSNSYFIQQSLNSIDKFSSPAAIKTVVSDLTQFLALKTKPFSDHEKQKFKLIHDDYASISHRLNTMRKKVARKLKLIRLIKKLSGIQHNGGEILSKLGQQIDEAAKGTYILNRDLETTSRFVARIDNAIERNVAILKLCLKRRYKKLAAPAMEEMKKSNLSLRKNVEEIEEHLFLCLVTINRARAMVIKQINGIK